MFIVSPDQFCAFRVTFCRSMAFDRSSGVTLPACIGYQFGCGDGRCFGIVHTISQSYFARYSAISVIVLLLTGVGEEEGIVGRGGVD